MSDTPLWREPTRAQWICFGAAWLGWVLDAFDFTVFLLVMPQIAREFGVSMTATAGSITLTLLLRLLGGVAAGAVADRFGRKLPLMISVVWFAACDGAVALAPSFGWILALRMLFGLGMGAEWTAGATLAMESWPARSRGIASGVLQGSWGLGYFAAAQVSAEVVPRWGWRAMFALAALPALLAIPIRFWVPESRAAAKAADTEAEESRAAAPPAGEARSRSAPAGEARSSSGARSPAHGTSEGHLARLAWGALVMALGFGAYYALTGLYPTLLQTRMGMTPAAVAPFVSWFNVGMMAGAVICGLAASRLGPQLAIGAPAFLAVLALPLYLGAVPPALAAGAFLGGVLGAGHSGVTPLLLTSLFPAQVRARSIGIVYHAGAFAAAFVPMGIAWATERFHLDLRLAMGAVAGTCSLLLSLLMLLRPAPR
jgi:SHS family lactate transporter-like MFS transporter